MIMDRNLENLHSDELQEMIGKKPSWMIKSGEIGLIIILAFLFFGCWLIKKPDIVIAPISLEVVNKEALSEEFEIVGIISVPSSGIGKIKEGQQVIVKLNGFPYMEFGIIRGIVRNISIVPEESQYDLRYPVEIQFPEGLVTSYNKQVTFFIHMDGTAEIITEERRLIEYFFYPVLSIIKNTHLD